MKRLCLFILMLIMPTFLFACAKQNKTKLATPTEVSVEAGEVVFCCVENAEAYTVDFGSFSRKITPNSQEVELFNESGKNYLSFDASNLMLVGKNYVIKVCAHAEKMKDSDFSAPINYKHAAKLQTPTAILNAGFLTWDKVWQADYYLVEVSAPFEMNIETFSIDENRFDLKRVLQMSGNYEFRVKAASSNQNFIESEFSTPISFVNVRELQTAQLSKVQIVDGDRHILAVVDSTATKVGITIDNQEKIVSINSPYIKKVDGTDNFIDINLTEFASSELPQLSFDEYRVYSICVRLLNDSENSNFSNIQEFENLAPFSAPTCEYLDGQLKWEDEGEESEYKVIVATDEGKEEYLFPSNVRRFILPENARAASVMKLKNGTHSNSPLSNWVSSLDISTAEQQGSVEENFVSWSAEGSFYIVEIDGKIACTSEPKIDLSLLENKIDSFLVLSCGEEVSLIRVKINQSLYLAAPSALTFSITNPYLLQIEPVANAYGYYVFLKGTHTDELDYVRIDHLFTSANIDLSNYLSKSEEYGYSVKVQAVGMPYGAFETSELSDPVEIVHNKRLETPLITQQSIKKEQDKCYINFNSVEGAAKYLINVNYVPKIVDAQQGETQKFELSELLAAAGQYTITVRALPSDDDAFVQASEFSTPIVYTNYVQLESVADLLVDYQDGQYILSFTEQANAENYLIKIVYGGGEVNEKDYLDFLSGKGLRESFFITSSPFNLSNYVNQPGSYKVFITAVAEVNSFFSNSSTVSVDFTAI